MGGSGGSGRGSRLSERDLQAMREEAQARLERSRLDAEVNSFLQHELADINNRDVDAVNRRLDEIEESLRDSHAEVDRLLFGGSVAKHTYVDGFSDIDSLVVLDPTLTGDRMPDDIRLELRDTLARKLNLDDVRNIRAGTLAVTVTYRDGLEIQLLPAVSRNDTLEISSSTGEAWTSIDPKAFSDRLSRANSRNAGALVAAIKLAKAALATQLSDSDRPSGYHVEALALAAFEAYDGPRTPKAMLQRFFTQASRDVLRPISDVTGQSVYVDDSLGPADSPSRQKLGRQLAQIAKALSTAASLAEWQQIYPDD
jgi:predicted nucleotidyltransferase